MSANRSRARRSANHGLLDIALACCRFFREPDRHKRLVQRLADVRCPPATASQAHRRRDPAKWAARPSGAKVQGGLSITPKLAASCTTARPLDGDLDLRDHSLIVEPLHTQLGNEHSNDGKMVGQLARPSIVRDRIWIHTNQIGERPNGQSRPREFSKEVGIGHCSNHMILCIISHKIMCTRGPHRIPHRI
jgi:hypothetical protein